MNVGESYMVGSSLNRGNGRIPLHADRDAAASEEAGKYLHEGT